MHQISMHHAPSSLCTGQLDPAYQIDNEIDLYLVTRFMSGGELFWHLQMEGHSNDARSKPYILEQLSRPPVRPIQPTASCS